MELVSPSPPEHKTEFHQRSSQRKKIKKSFGSDFLDLNGSPMCKYVNIKPNSKLCFYCQEKEDKGKLISCKFCRCRAHQHCYQNNSGVVRKGYKNLVAICSNCRPCERCNGKQEKVYFCSRCNSAYHVECEEKLSVTGEVPELVWKCSICDTIDSIPGLNLTEEERMKEVKRRKAMRSRKTPGKRKMDKDCISSIKVKEEYSSECESSRAPFEVEEEEESVEAVAEEKDEKEEKEESSLQENETIDPLDQNEDLNKASNIPPSVSVDTSCSSFVIEPEEVQVNLSEENQHDECDNVKVNFDASTPMSGVSEEHSPENDFITEVQLNSQEKIKDSKLVKFELNEDVDTMQSDAVMYSSETSDSLMNTTIMPSVEKENLQNITTPFDCNSEEQTIQSELSQILCKKDGTTQLKKRLFQRTCKAQFNLMAVSQWSTQDVGDYLRHMGFDQEAESFQEQDIDGKSLLLLSRNDVLCRFNFKLGPAVKIFAYIYSLQEKTRLMGKA